MPTVIASSHCIYITHVQRCGVRSCDKVSYYMLISRKSLRHGALHHSETSRIACNKNEGGPHSGQNLARPPPASPRPGTGYPPFTDRIKMGIGAKLDGDLI